MSSELHRLAALAMELRDLRPAFTPAALQEAEAAGAAGPDSRGDIRDLRKLPWFSIDNDDTRDIDQLSMAEALGGGAARLRVAIAEVDGMVRTGGAVDEHAAHNTTSVYTAAGVFPMLPELLSTGLTSLHEGEERIAVVVEMRVEADGTVSQAQLYRAAVFNHAKLTYNGVAAWLEGGAAPEALARLPVLPEQVRLHDDIASRLRQGRSRRGALNVQTASARPVFDKGRLVDLVPDTKNRAKDLIADLMIATNSATARFLVEQRFPSLRRVLEAPRRWDRIVQLAAGHGVPLPEAPDAVALDAFLQARRKADPGGFEDLSLAVIKMLGSGDYTAAAPGEPSVGHFGLAVSDYTHSTAPNRRFTDLVTQRLIKAALARQSPPYSVDSLHAIARHCTLQENNANKVERQVLKAAAAWLLQHRVGESFDALVTGAAAKGTFVRITRPMIEGRLVRGLEGVDVGDKLRVRLVSVRPELGYIDFERG